MFKMGLAASLPNPLYKQTLTRCKRFIANMLKYNYLFGLGPISKKYFKKSKNINRSAFLKVNSLIGSILYFCHDKMVS